MENDKKELNAGEAEQMIGKDLEQVFGDSGTSRYNGYYSEEPNVQWRDEQRIKNVEEMRRSDGAVKAVLNAIKAPILSTEWSIYSYDDSPRAKNCASVLIIIMRLW